MNYEVPRIVHNVCQPRSHRASDTKLPQEADILSWPTGCLPNCEQSEKRANIDLGGYRVDIGWRLTKICLN